MGCWQQRLLKCTLWGLVQMHHVSTVCSAGVLYDATTLFSSSSFMHQHCSGVLSGWHIQSVKMHLCRINIVRSAANTATPYILYASTVCCADKTEGTQTKSYASTMTTVLLWIIIVEACSLLTNTTLVYKTWTQLDAKCSSFMTHQQRWFAWKYNVRRCISTACINIVRSGASAATLLCINIPTPCSGPDHTLRLMCSQEHPPLHQVYSFWPNNSIFGKKMVH